MQMAAVLEQFPTLTTIGFENPADLGFAERRSAMIHRVILDEFDRASGWLLHVPKVNCGGADSYALKHVVEDWCGFYITNGAMVAAAACADFRVEWSAGDLNAILGVAGPRHWPLGASRRYDWIRERFHNKVAVSAEIGR